MGPVYYRVPAVLRQLCSSSVVAEQRHSLSLDGMQLYAFALLCALLQVSPSDAHVQTTFPPARQPNYDYLDNYETGGPCGVPGEQQSFT